jgi:phosphoserine aminotransferase
MTSSVHNFNAGPAVLPKAALEKAQAELLDYAGSGMSILEMSHRSPAFDAIMQKTEADLRLLMGIPAEYRVLFLQGGASLQFAMLPMNLRPEGASADYIVNGAWGRAALQDAQRLGKARVAHSTESTGFDRISPLDALDLDAQAAYLHFTSNETIHGVEWQIEPPSPSGVPLVCDMSSDFLSRPVEVRKYGLIYAGAQKNAGPAGVTIVILREDLLERAPASLPVMLSYPVQVKGGSMHNTPPCFAIYLVGLVSEWLKSIGGLPEIQRRNHEKARLVYQAIDTSGSFYRGHAQLASRSVMNVTFRLPSEQLEADFAKKAQAQGLIGLKGHRSVGGIRASLYNALDLDSVQVLVQFMAEYLRVNG